MNRVASTILITAALALSLGGCGSGPDINFDPLDWISGDLFNTKKPLPGERKALFPEGVPGVARGVPPEIVKGNQPPPEAEGTPQEASLQADEPKPKPITLPPPEQPPSQQTHHPQPPPQQPGAAQWPEPPSPQSQAPAAVQWPDPPPVR